MNPRPNITGLWKGYYEYGPAYGTQNGEKVNFSLYIEEAPGGQFNGDCKDRVEADSTDNAFISGFVEGNAMHFEKIYGPIKYINESVGLIEDFESKYIDESGKLIEGYELGITVLFYDGEYDDNSETFNGSWGFSRDPEEHYYNTYPKKGTGTWSMKKVFSPVYLVKTDDGKISHFRTMVSNHGLNIVSGTFYSWIASSSEYCEDEETALSLQKQLIVEKLSEGYEVTEFEPLPENTVTIYDNAKWHLSHLPKDLATSQAFVHTGMFLGWLIDNDLVSDEFKNEHQEEINKFRCRLSTGPQLFDRCCDGMLLIEDLSETGNRFALHYFDFSLGQYLKDYKMTLGGNFSLEYSVADSWENYFTLCKVVDERFKNWKKQSFTDQ